MTPSQNHRQIAVSEMAPHVHVFKSGENKVKKISMWLINWIEKSLKAEKIKPNDMLPSKGDLAFHIGVSIGTIQNVFRLVEDYGLIESKQKIGTYIKDKNNKNNIKLTSKREVTAEAIKKFILENNYQKGERLLSTRKLSKLLNITNTTINMALNSLITENIIEKVNNTFIIKTLDFDYKNLKSETLVTKTASKIKQYILNNLELGDRLPTNEELAKIFNVSIKTIHDSIKLISKEGILHIRRGRYGTVLVNINDKTPLYDYEKIENKIRNFISKNYAVGEKLPSIIELGKKYNVSAKTIKRALDNLAEEGYITFVRGRYGGTFITDIPQEGNEAYKWLALTQEYIPNIETSL